MENLEPILKKIQHRLAHFLSTGEVLKLMDLLARQGIWVDIALRPGGPGILEDPQQPMVSSPFKEKVLCRMDHWASDYDLSFLRANRIKLS